MIYDVIIIGAGAAGLFCGSAPEWTIGGASNRKAVNTSKRDFCSAEPAEAQSLRGLILEKGRRPGRKLLMSGSGQCNITHAGSIKDFVGCYGGYPMADQIEDTEGRTQKKHGSLLRSCLYKYNNLSLMAFLEDGGVKTVIREDGKVFPTSMSARDVLDLLLRKTAENGFEIRYGNDVKRIEALLSDAGGDPATTVGDDTALNEGAAPAPGSYGWRVHTSDGSYMTHTLVIATGGCSFPTTGSDGSMFSVLKRDLGISVTPLKPALSSVQAEKYPYSALSGISFDPAGISIWRGEKKIAENADSLLFTHEDLSGPGILNISKYAEPGDILKINYIYPLTYEAVLHRLKAVAHGSKGSLAGIIASEFHLPLRFCRLLTEQYGSSLKTLTRQLTEQALRVTSVTGFHKAMATSGGAALSQMDLNTMVLKERCGLYIIGEALDVDGITGGYNLQFAYSSGRAAAADINNVRSGG